MLDNKKLYKKIYTFIENRRKIEDGQFSRV